MSAAARGATLLVTPELALTGYDIGDLGDDLTSPSLVDDAAAIARRRKASA
jgi:predicted amidohydrolase